MDASTVSREQEARVNAGDLALAEQILEAWLREQDGDDSFVPRLELARVRFWRGRPRQARELLERLLRERPGDTWTTSLLAQVEIALGDHERARELLERAVALDPSNHEARLFLGGDVHDDALRARQRLTHGTPSPRARIEIGTLCAAIDFRRGRRVAIQHGPLTQAYLDRANLRLDGAEIGDDVDVPASQRAALLRAERIVYYTSHAFGDALLGLSAVTALLRFFELRPEAQRPIEIVSPYAEVLGALAEHHPLVAVHGLSRPRDPAEAAIAAEDLRRRRERTVAITNAGPHVARALIEAARDHAHVVAVLDVHIDRHARGLDPWQSTRPPYRHLLAYPARLHRMMEMVLGIKLLDDPAAARVTLSLSAALSRVRAEALVRHGIAGAEYHCVVESASKKSKQFDPELLRTLLRAMAAECARQEHWSGRRHRVVFCRDRQPEHSLAGCLAELPDDARRYLLDVDADLSELAGILAGAQTTVSTDTGIAHLSAALGRPTLILFTMADPFLWSAGGSHVRALWSHHAFAAHLNRTPVNMQAWEADRPVMAESIQTRDVIDAWRRCLEICAGEDRSREGTELDHHPLVTAPLPAPDAVCAADEPAGDLPRAGEDQLEPRGRVLHEPVFLAAIAAVADPAAGEQLEDALVEADAHIAIADRLTEAPQEPRLDRTAGRPGRRRRRRVRE
jgi:tetratricopeptide (TPR) repeat protein